MFSIIPTTMVFRLKIVSHSQHDVHMSVSKWSSQKVNKQRVTKHFTSSASREGGCTKRECERVPLGARGDVPRGRLSGDHSQWLLFAFACASLLGLATGSTPSLALGEDEVGNAVHMLPLLIVLGDLFNESPGNRRGSEEALARASALNRSVPAPVSHVRT